MIRTPRLCLRPWCEDDKPAAAALLNTLAVTEYLDGVKDRATFDALIDGQMAMQVRHGLSLWAVESLEDRTLAGLCGLRFGGHAGTAVPDELEIGWRFGERFWGRGFAREAAAACLRWGWENTGRPRISAWTVPANGASRGLMLRLGMVRRPDLDFDHPRFPDGHPLRRHVVYVAERAAALRSTPDEFDCGSGC
ncbi:MAG: GNAT family N-acetyltransferase [Methylobacterium frigidaeris]